MMRRPRNQRAKAKSPIKRFRDHMAFFASVCSNTASITSKEIRNSEIKMTLHRETQNNLELGTQSNTTNRSQL